MAVVGSELNPGAVAVAGESGAAAGVELIEDTGGHFAVAYGIEDAQEMRVLLAVHLLQFDDDVRALPQGMARKEVWGGVMLAQQVPLFLYYYGGKLAQVADEQQLHAAEGERRAAQAAQGVVHGVEKVGSHHAYFVDDQHVDAVDELQLLFAETVRGLVRRAGDEGTEVELEERVERHTAGIDGCDAGGRGHHYAFVR